MNTYYKSYTDLELANQVALLPFQDDLLYELAERLYRANVALLDQEKELQLEIERLSSELQDALDDLDAANA